MVTTYHTPSRAERAASTSGRAIFDSGRSFGYFGQNTEKTP